MSDREVIERPGFFIKRLDQGVRMTAEEAKAVGPRLRGSPEAAKAYTDLLGSSTGRFFRLLTAADREGGFGVNFVSLTGGNDFPRHRHENRRAFLYVINGRGKAVIDGETHAIGAGDCVFLRANAVHELFADPGPLEYLAITCPDLETPDPDGTFDFVLT